MKMFNMRKRASGMAMGIALATGAMAATSVLPAEAHAQRAPKGEKKSKSSKKTKHSKQFTAAYNEVAGLLQGITVDTAALGPKVDALVAAASTQSEKNSAGRAIFEAGSKSSNAAMQFQGIELVLGSGMASETEAGQFNFIAYQLASNLKDFGKAQSYLRTAIDLGFAPTGNTPNDLRATLAETYFSQNQFREGLAALRQAIDIKIQQGETVDEAWYRRGLGIAYNNEVLPETYDWAALWVGKFPSDKNWRDAVNITRNLNEFESPEMLDVLRLAKRVGVLDERDAVTYYVESADARRLPLEVKNVIEAFFAVNAAARDDIYLVDQLAVAKQRIPTDRTELPELEAEADATTTDTKIVMAAGDTFYSYGEYAKAERFFAKALNMPGVETQVALTRLGMAQIELGKIDEAKATLAKVTGVRKSIAGLWTAYADDQVTGG